MSGTNWTSRKTEGLEGVLEHKWTDVMKGLNIGNRAPFRKIRDIIHEDVVESR
jgi:hypothetical protein